MEKMEEPKSSDVGFKVTKFITDSTYQDIPSEAIDATKKDILDTLGTALAGSSSPGIEEIWGLVSDWNGKKESTVIAYSSKIPSNNAALINGTMAHARDFDDCHDLGVVHAGASVIPAAFAVAERYGKVNGKQFLTAVALGIDLSCRLGIAAGVAPATSGWHNTGIFGIFGATAACGKIVGLDNKKMQNALGIAYSQSSGTMQARIEGTLSKRLHAGLASRGAVLSALLADRGYTGPSKVFEGEKGLFNVYFGGKCDSKALTSGLGTTFEVCNLGFKPYPCCRQTHNAIFSALTLRKDHHFKPREIEKIVAFVGKNTQLALCSPLERKRKPQSIVDAQFSLPYTVARAIIHGNVCLSDFSEEGISDRTVLEMAQKVELQEMPQFTQQTSTEPVIIEVRTADGKVYSKRVDYPYGNPRNPISMEEITLKFRDCASYARKTFRSEAIEHVIELIARSEHVDDVGQIIQCLA